jgi:hypothetical protein
VEGTVNNLRQSIVIHENGGLRLKLHAKDKIIAIIHGTKRAGHAVFLLCGRFA